MRKKQKSIFDEVKDTLGSQLAIGQNKHQDKNNGDTDDKIYSWNTFRSYQKHSFEFVNWARDVEKNPHITEQLGHKPRNLKEIRSFVGEWIEGEISRGMSAPTVHLKAAALAKLYRCSSMDFGVKLPERHRADITRSRSDAKRDDHFSEENNVDLVTFCKCTGLRRSELMLIRGEDLSIGKDGNLYLTITRGTKGGRPRISKLCGSSEELERIKTICEEKGKRKLFPYVPEADIHGYRSVYCCRIYKAAARNLDEYRNERLIVYNNRIIEIYTSPDRSPDRSKSQYYDENKKDRHGNVAMKKGYRDVSSVYVCRTDKAKTYYDRQAMFEASAALGHNRESVIASNYLYNL